MSNPKVDTVRLLINHGADVSVQDKTRSTPLHMAALFGSFETVLLLLEHGADINAQDGRNKTPLHLALSVVGATMSYCLSRKHIVDLTG
jgi:ankyrin repeat protein